MSSEIFRVLRCDRCDFTVEVRQVGADNGWGGISARRDATEAQASVMIGGRDPDDLCPGCMDGLLNWWREPGEVRQPTPAPPPPPAPTPKPAKVSRAQLAAAIAVLQEELKLQTERAFAVVRDQPTAILSGEVVPGALAPIERAAVSAIGRIVTALGVSVGLR